MHQTHTSAAELKFIEALIYSFFFYIKNKYRKLVRELHKILKFLKHFAFSVRNNLIGELGVSIFVSYKNSRRFSIYNKIN